jgi:hypothetical protein
MIQTIDKAVKSAVLLASTLLLCSCPPVPGSHPLITAPPKPAVVHALPPWPPENGIFVDKVKTYDEATLEQILNKAVTSLSQLNAFSSNVTNQLGQIQGSTANQTSVGLTAGTGTAPTQTAPPAYTLPTSTQVSASNFLNEELQLSMQMTNMQLLLTGALNDQSKQGDLNYQKTKETLGFPIYITTPQGYKYQGAVAEVDVSVCAPADSKAEPLLSLLLPQEKTYNVASLVSKSASIGGSATIAGVVNLGGSFLRGHQSFYMVQDQDTLAVQRDPDLTVTCPNNKPPVSFAWQFHPVLGQKVVRDGLRQSFAQVAFSTPFGGYLACTVPVTIKTGWRHYDLQTGRVGDPIDPFIEKSYPAFDFSLPPIPGITEISDNGDGNLTVVATGAFRTPTRVRIGGIVLDPTATPPQAEQNARQIRFVASASDLVTKGAWLLNKDGLEWPIVPQEPYNFTKPVCSASPSRAAITLIPNHASAGSAPAVAIDGGGERIAAGIAIDATYPITVGKVERADATHLTASLTIPTTTPTGPYIVTVPTSSGALKAGTFTVDPPAAPAAVPPAPAPGAAPSLTLSTSSGHDGQLVRTEVSGFTANVAAGATVKFECPNNDATVCGGDLQNRNIELLNGGQYLAITFFIAPDALPGPWKLKVDDASGAPLGRATFAVNDVSVRPFDATQSLVTLWRLRPLRKDGNPEVVVIGTKIFGLLNLPYYERTSDHVTVLATNDLLRTARKITWRKLLDIENRQITRDIPFSPTGADRATDTVIAGIIAVSSSSTSAGSSPSKADITVVYQPGSVTAFGAGLVAIGNGTPSIIGLSVSGGQHGELTPLQNVIITGAFTSFKKPGVALNVLFNDPDIQATHIVPRDDTHLTADITVGPNAHPGPAVVTVQTGTESASGGIFTVGDAKTLVTSVQASGPPANPTLLVTGGAGSRFDLGAPIVRFSRPEIVISAPPVVVSPTQLKVTVNVGFTDKNGPGNTDVTVENGPSYKAGGTGVFVPYPNAPYIEAVTPAALRPGESRSLDIKGVRTAFAGTPDVKFSIPEMKGDSGAVANATQMSATVRAPATAPQKPTNTLAITGSGLTGLQIVAPPVTPDYQSAELVIFSLTEDQAKAKNIILQDATGRRYLQAMPSATPAAAKAPSVKAQPKEGIPASQTTLALTGNGMSQVVAVRYLSTFLSFTSSSDTDLTLQLPTPLAAPGIEVVFVYQDKTLAPYLIPVAAAK